MGHFLNTYYGDVLGNSEEHHFSEYRGFKSSRAFFNGIGHSAEYDSAEVNTRLAETSADTTAQ